MRWAWSIPLILGLSWGCGGKVKAPVGPGKKPSTGKAKASKPKLGRRPVREILLGEMCPKAAAGRAAVLPVFVRRVSWDRKPAELLRPLQRRAARQFAVLGWDGARAGLFNVAGLAKVGLDRSVAVGAYAGSSPCKVLTAGSNKRTLNRTCVAAQDHCGLAIAVLEKGSGFGARPFEEDPDPHTWKVGGACVANGKLLVDIDADGEPEAFPVSQFLNAVRHPAEEVTAVPRGRASCKATFASRNVLPPGDPRHWRGLDVLGVLDMDGDGRNELIVSYHYADRRTWAVYSAGTTAVRLDLMGESMPFPRP